MVEDVSDGRIYTLATLGFLAGGTYLTWFKGKDGLNAPFIIGCVMFGIALVADWNFNRKANSRSGAWEAEYRDEELLYKDDFETMTPIPDEKGVFVATRINEPQVTYFIREESVAGDRLYRILTIEEAGTNSPLHPKRIEATMDSGSGDAIIKYIRHRNQQRIDEYEWQNPDHKGLDSLWCFNCGERASPSEESQERDSGTTEDTCTACGNELIDLESMSYQEYAAEAGGWGGMKLTGGVDEIEEMLGRKKRVEEYAAEPSNDNWDKIERYLDSMTTEGKHTASPIIEALQNSDDETKAEALDWLIDNYYIHADEQWNAAHLLALGDALGISHEFERTMGAESFAVEAYDEKMTVWICGGCNSRFEDQNDAEACCEGIPEDELYHHDPKSRDARKVHLQGGKQGDWRAEAMSPSAVVAKKGRVRTVSGKPHTPRKLKKDQNITPEEARKRVRLEAQQNPPAEAFNPAELIGDQLVRPDGPMTADQAQGFMTNLRRYRKQMAAEDTDDTEEEDWQDIIMEISVAGELFDDLAYYFPDEWYNIFLSAYDDPEAEGYQILIIHEDDFDTFIEMRDSLRYLPPSPAREIKEGINLEAFWDEEMEI